MSLQSIEYALESLKKAVNDLESHYPLGFPLIDFLPNQITSYRNTISGMVTMERIVVRT